MARYIDADALLEEDFTDKWYDIDDQKMFEDIIDMSPTADVVEVKHGEWIKKRWTTEDDWGCINHRSIVCSACENEFYKGDITNYCPYCGAMMRKEYE